MCLLAGRLGRWVLVGHRGLCSVLLYLVEEVEGVFRLVRAGRWWVGRLRRFGSGLWLWLMMGQVGSLSFDRGCDTLLRL